MFYTTSKIEKEKQKAAKNLFKDWNRKWKEKIWKKSPWPKACYTVWKCCEQKKTRPQQKLLLLQRRFKLNRQKFQIILKESYIFFLVPFFSSELTMFLYQFLLVFLFFEVFRRNHKILRIDKKQYFLLFFYLFVLF